MPVKYTVYGCEFKCGYRHTKNLARVMQHERQCWYNPECRTCKTCRYEVYRSDTSGTAHGYTEPSWWERDCTNQEGKEWVDRAINTLYDEQEKRDGHRYGPVPPVVDCPYWKEPETWLDVIKRGPPPATIAWADSSAEAEEEGAG